MNMSRVKRLSTRKVLFVWSGARELELKASRIVDQLEDAIVYSVHAMPHESIYHYGANQQQVALLESQLHSKFRKSVAGHRPLVESRFELLYGERLTEIVRYAEQRKVDFILAPEFEQSSFSKWIHGDLNEKFIKRSHCPVVFLGQQRVRQSV